MSIVLQKLYFFLKLNIIQLKYNDNLFYMLYKKNCILKHSILDEFNLFMIYLLKYIYYFHANEVFTSSMNVFFLIHYCF